MSPVKNSPGPTINCQHLPKPQLLDVFHKDKKICEIEPTSPEIKLDPYEVYRPPVGKYLDYQLSQTDAKFDKKLTKIHLQYTRAEYGELNPDPPKPKQKKKRNTYFHGRGPCWIWVEEIWAKKEMEMQVFYKKRLKQITKERIAYEKAGLARGHRRLIKLVGPTWFIELSPNQQKAVDGLKNAILRDLKYHSLSNIKDVIADLGLVLRPNAKHVEKALKESSYCPVEFLLILYQLMNPNRAEYTLNDKLLLSAVVHLTIKETLKELHIRIPSPPPKPSPPRIRKKRKPKHRYPSPYLETFTFEREPPKHTGVYKNNHRQYPESPYFLYVEQLKMKRESIKRIKNEDEKEVGYIEERPQKRPDLPPDLAAKEEEILQELAMAQEEYNSLAEDGQAPPLLKPSIYYPCNLVPQSRSERPPSGGDKSWKKLVVTPKPSSKSPKEIESGRTVVTTVKGSNTISLPKTKTRSDVCGTFSGVTTATTRSKESGSEGFSRGKTTAPLSTDVNVYNTGEEDIGEVEAEEYEPDLAFVCDCGCFADDEKEELKIPPYEFKSKREILVPQICDLTINKSDLIYPEQSESDICTCKEGVLEAVENNFCPCERCQKDREAWFSRKATKVISGTRMEDVNERGVQVIDSVKQFQGCSCLRNYEYAIRRFEELKARLKAQVKLMSLKKPFVVTGVSVGRDGRPCYQLSGVVPDLCPCLGIVKKLEEEEKRLSNMPRLPADGRQHYITGVQQTPAGTVFNIGGTLQTRDCICLELFKEFSDRHETCLNVYAEYLEKMKKDLCLYLQELEEDNRTRTTGKWGPTPFEIRDEEERIKNFPQLPVDGKTYQVTGVRGMIKGGQLVYEISGIKDAPENVCTVCCRCCPGKIERKQLLERLFPSGFDSEDDGENDFKVEEDQGDGITDISFGSSVASKKKSSKGASRPNTPESKVSRPIPKTPPTSRTEYPPKSKSASTKQDKNKVCICGTDSIADLGNLEELICDCGKDEGNFNFGNRRIMIFDKIPTKWKDQLTILKQALKYLAEDGYPLAKIPDCEKLPIFKLWFQLRSGKYFSMDDRIVFWRKSKRLWKHYDKCKRKCKLPILPVSKEEAKKFTYKQSTRVKKMVEICLDSYYRKLKQNNIDLSREFFPTLFTYEFPTPSFRDCFFSYCPAKEEHCICYNL